MQAAHQDDGEAGGDGGGGDPAVDGALAFPEEGGAAGAAGPCRGLGRWGGGVVAFPPAQGHGDEDGEAQHEEEGSLDHARGAPPRG